MNAESPFVDYYEILQVDPGCDAKILEAAYRHLAKTYHPDHPETADVDRFSIVVEAYNALRHPDRRAEYDVLHAANVEPARHAFSANASAGESEQTAIDDADAHAEILLLLYKTRRERAQQPGVGEYYLQDMLKCSDDTFAFHRWYLKSKGFIEVTEEGTLAITIAGVDHVIAMSRATKEKLRIAQAG